MAKTTLIRRMSKMFFYILLFIGIGRSLPNSEVYVDGDIASGICALIYGDVNAETIYDVYFYIDMLIILMTITPIYYITLKLIRLVRRT